MADETKLKAGDVLETRISLSFFGGVALAVYESGVAAEFFRLVKGEGVYAQLKETVGEVVVDIITGTSAGGLNGAFLANALVNRGDIRKLFTLWCTEGDIDKLLYGVLKSAPQSLLDGDRYREKIFSALMAKRSVPPSEAALQPEIDLFLTATNIDGDRIVITTPENEEIPTLSHRQVFHFRFRKKEKDTDEEDVNDFKTEEDLCLLAQAARTSSSFPLAFEPMLVTKSGLGRRALHLEADAFHIDGGVLDNKPIELALGAIAARRADRQIQRILFYVDPDPEEIESRVCQIVAKRYSAPEVAVKALVGLPGYQSITTALQNIQQRNTDTAELQRTLKYYETVATAFGEKQEGPQEEMRIRYVVPDDGPTALFRAQEDGYLDLRLQRAFPPAFFSLFKATTDEARKVTGRQERAIKESIYLLQTKILLAFDLNYHKRMYRYLIQIVRTLYPDKPTGTGDGEGRVWQYIADTTQRLNLLKDFIYDQERLVSRQMVAQADEMASEQAEIEAQLRELGEKLRERNNAPLSASSTGTNATLLGDFITKLSSRDFFRDRIAFLDRLKSTVLHRLENERAELLAEWGKKDRKALKQGFEERVKAGYLCLRDAIQGFYLRDIIIYPMTAGDEFAGELREIDFARISPADADQFIPGLNVADKLAGETLAHFGGFLSEEWRGNDLTWGRLDTAEIIIRKLLPNADPNIRNELIKAAQAEIIAEMNSLGMGIYATHSGAATPGQPPPRDQLIGKQDLSAIPGEKKINWSWRGAVTFLKIVRESLAMSRAAFLLRVPLMLLDKLILVMTGVFVLFAWVLARLFRPRVLVLVVAGVGLIGVGVLLHLAWEHSMHELWDRFFSASPK